MERTLIEGYEWMLDGERRVLESITTEELAGLLRKLVRTVSINPPGDCREVCRACAEEFEKSDIPFTTLAAKEELPCLIARLEGKNPSPVLLFNAHMDTVPAGDLERWSHYPFGADVEQDRLYGRGAGDDKASIVAQIGAAKAIKRAGVRLGGTLLVSPVADEEAGGFLGTHWLKETGYLKPDWVVIGEQTNNQVAICERIVCRMELTVYGRSAHGAQPWHGENAIVDMARAIMAIEERLVPAIGKKKHGFLPPSSLSIGTIQGGIRVNMVPDCCKIAIDRRMHPGETPETVERELKELLDTISSGSQPLKYNLMVQGFGTGSVSTNPKHELIKTMQKAVVDVAGQDRVLIGYSQGSDGRHFSQEGVPVAIFGPGDPCLAHAANEYVSLHQVVEAAQVLALTALRMLGSI